MKDYKLATIEAHELLQINPANRDEEWENDRRSWLVEWESKLTGEPLNKVNRPDANEDCNHSYQSMPVCVHCGHML